MIMFDIIIMISECHIYICKARKHTLQVIDICGPTPKGTGLQNMREAIIESKWKYDVSPEDKQVLNQSAPFSLFAKLIKSIQVGWKSLILDFMERYFYLICFAAYALEHGPNNYQKSFKSWMDDHNELRQFNDFIKHLR